MFLPRIAFSCFVNPRQVRCAVLRNISFCSVNKYFHHALRHNQLPRKSGCKKNICCFRFQNCPETLRKTMLWAWWPNRPISGPTCDVIISRNCARHNTIWIQLSCVEKSPVYYYYIISESVVSTRINSTSFWEIFLFPFLRWEGSSVVLTVAIDTDNIMSSHRSAWYYVICNHSCLREKMLAY